MYDLEFFIDGCSRNAIAFSSPDPDPTAADPPRSVMLLLLSLSLSLTRARVLFSIRTTKSPEYDEFFQRKERIMNPILNSESRI